MKPIEPSTPLGWIGTGVMGASMCRHLMDLGHPMTVFNRTRSKADPLVAAGATWADSPKAVAEQSQVVFSIVGFPQDVRSVILGDDGALAGFAATGGEGKILVDMTRVNPRLRLRSRRKPARSARRA